MTDQDAGAEAVVTRWDIYLAWYEGDAWVNDTSYLHDPDSPPESKEFQTEMRDEFRRGVAMVDPNNGRDHDVDLRDVERVIYWTAWGLDHADSGTGESDKDLCYLQGVRFALKKLGATPRDDETPT